ncbi:MAG: PQQ-binding-like beta-propeller repeat protein [Verrucomicrobiales bacterium]|nr:PQQ-binding-like beta-propeller repeat protein [Verrucomicrobiales bacterium]
MNPSTLLRPALHSALALAFLLPVFARSEWSRFRGENGSGVNEKAELPTEWSEENQFWSVDLPGQGHGSPVVSGNRIYLLSAVEDPGEAPDANPKKAKKKGKGNSPKPYRWQTLCLDAETGKTVWTKEFSQGRFKGHRFNSAASSTAAVDEDQVVFAWGTADQLTVVSLTLEGELQWEKDLGPVVGGHGFGGSPILFEDLVILNNDQEKQNGNLLALDAKTGEVKWTAERRSQRISYSVPCVYEVEGKPLLVFVNWQHGFTAIDPEDGSVVSEKSVFNLETNERAISSPIVTQGLVIGTCGFTANPKHCVAMKIEAGEWQEVWRIERNVPHIPSVIAVGEYAFLIDDSGIGTCVESATGKEIWKKRIPGVEGAIFGSPVSDGANLFFADESGNVHVLAASPEFTPVVMNRLGELCRTTPAIANDTIYVRSETKLTAWR